MRIFLSTENVDRRYVVFVTSSRLVFFLNRARAHKITLPALFTQAKRVACGAFAPGEKLLVKRHCCPSIPPRHKNSALDFRYRDRDSAWQETANSIICLSSRDACKRLLRLLALCGSRDLRACTYYVIIIRAFRQSWVRSHFFIDNFIVNLRLRL